jgi:hypothetical protein
VRLRQLHTAEGGCVASCLACVRLVHRWATNVQCAYVRPAAVQLVLVERLQGACCTCCHSNLHTSSVLRMPC